MPTRRRFIGRTASGLAGMAVAGSGAAGVAGQPATAADGRTGARGPAAHEGDSSGDHVRVGRGGGRYR